MDKSKNVWQNIKRGLIWFFKSYIWIVPLCVIVDQVSKICLESFLKSNGGAFNDWFLKGFISLELHYNTGAAWSFLEDHPIILAIISVVASIAIIAYITYSYKKLALTYRIAGYLVLGGCMGNMIDRIVYYPHGVIDFLKFDFITFPVFNGADSMLVIGIIIIIIKMLIDEHNEGKKKDEAKTTNNE